MLNWSYNETIVLVRLDPGCMSAWLISLTLQIPDLTFWQFHMIQRWQQCQQRVTDSTIACDITGPKSLDPTGTLTWQGTPLPEALPWKPWDKGHLLDSCSWLLQLALLFWRWHPYSNEGVDCFCFWIRPKWLLFDPTRMAQVKDYDRCVKTDLEWWVDKRVRQICPYLLINFL